MNAPPISDVRFTAEEARSEIVEPEAFAAETGVFVDGAGVVELIWAVNNAEENPATMKNANRPEKNNFILRQDCRQTQLRPDN